MHNCCCTQLHSTTGSYSLNVLNSFMVVEGKDTRPARRDIAQKGDEEICGTLAPPHGHTATKITHFSISMTLITPTTLSYLRPTASMSHTHQYSAVAFCPKPRASASNEACAPNSWCLGKRSQDAHRPPSGVPPLGCAPPESRCAAALVGRSR